MLSAGTHLYITMLSDRACMVWFKNTASIDFWSRFCMKNKIGILQFPK